MPRSPGTPPTPGVVVEESSTATMLKWGLGLGLPLLLFVILSIIFLVKCLSARKWAVRVAEMNCGRFFMLVWCFPDTGGVDDIEPLIR